MYLESTSCHSPKSSAGIQKSVALRFRSIFSSETEYSRKSKEYVAYYIVAMAYDIVAVAYDIVARGHEPEKVKSVSTEIEKITRSKAKTKKELTVNKKSVIFPAEYNPRGPSIKAVIKNMSINNTMIKFWLNCFPKIHLL